MKMKIRDSELDYKKLIIALIYIIALVALICISMKIYNNSKANEPKKSYGFNRMSQQEKDIYNSKIKPYIDDGVKGSEIKSMIDNIISMNQENVGEQGKFIGINVEADKITDYTEQENLLKACNDASVYDATSGSGTNGDNTEANVKAATQEMTKLKLKINSQKKYDVEATMSQGIYVWVKITETDKGTNNPSTSG